MIRFETVPTYSDSMLQKLDSGAFDPYAQLPECLSGRVVGMRRISQTTPYAATSPGWLS